MQQDGVVNQVNNPEVDVDVTKANSMIIVQIKQLTLITDKLHNAYRGWEVDWVDVGTYNFHILSRLLWLSFFFHCLQSAVVRNSLLLTNQIVSSFVFHLSSIIRNVLCKAARVSV